MVCLIPALSHLKSSVARCLSKTPKIMFESEIWVDMVQGPHLHAVWTTGQWTTGWLKMASGHLGGGQLAGDSLEG